MPERRDTIQTSLRLPKQLHTQLVALANERQVKLNDLVLKAVDEWLQQEKQREDLVRVSKMLESPLTTNRYWDESEGRRD